MSTRPKHSHDACVRSVVYIMQYLYVSCIILYELLYLSICVYVYAFVFNL